MATARFMLLLCARAGAMVLVALGVALGLGCARANEPTLVEPGRLVSPYPAASDVVWVVAPLTNESGSSLVDELAVTDELVNQIRQVRGLSALPTNRALAAMRALEIPAIRTPAEAIALATATGADAVLVGTITAWDPYDPPELGLSVALFTRTGAMHGIAATGSGTDPMTLRTAVREDAPTAGAVGMGPVSSVADHADASNHAVLAEVKAFAVGRHDDRTALGWQVYVKSMKRYTEFVCYRLMDRLLAAERARVSTATGHDNTQ
jgi:hypothetical protein